MITRAIPDIHPDSTKWYWLKWSQAELGTDITISSASWTLPSELTEEATSETGLYTGILLSVGVSAVAGSYYDAVCEIQTSNSEVLHESLRITVSAEGH